MAIKLSSDYRLNQLKEQTNILAEYITKVETGDKKYYSRIADLLRALICTGNKNFSPLLISLSKSLGEDLRCFGPRKAEGIFREAALFLRGLYISLDRDPIYGSRQVEYLFEDWIQTPLFVWGKIPYSPNLTLRTIADKEGSHFDEELPENLISLRENTHYYTRIGEINETERFLLNTAIATRDMSRRLIEKYQQN